VITTNQQQLEEFCSTIVYNGRVDNLTQDDKEMLAAHIMQVRGGDLETLELENGKLVHEMLPAIIKASGAERADLVIELIKDLTANAVKECSRHRGWLKSNYMTEALEKAVASDREVQNDLFNDEESLHEPINRNIVSIKSANRTASRSA